MSSLITAVSWAAVGLLCVVASTALTHSDQSSCLSLCLFLSPTALLNFRHLPRPGIDEFLAGLFIIFCAHVSIVSVIAKMEVKTNTSTRRSS